MDQLPMSQATLHDHDVDAGFGAILRPLGTAAAGQLGEGAWGSLSLIGKEIGFLKVVGM